VDRPTHRCGAIRRDTTDPDMLQRCGKDSGHHLDDDPDVARHGEWTDIGPASQAPDGTGWAGRVLDDLWSQITQEDPDAWRAPDDGDRAAEPPAGGTPEASVGWSVTGRGPRPGVTSMDIKLEDVPPGGGGTGAEVSIADVQAAMSAANGLIEEAQQALYAALEKAREAAGLAGSVLEGSGHEAARAGLARLTDAEAKITETIQVYEAAKGEFGTYVPGL
jgi:hypothetical protein